MFIGKKSCGAENSVGFGEQKGISTAISGENYVLTMGQVLCKEFYILHLI